MSPHAQVLYFVLLYASVLRTDTLGDRGMSTAVG